MANGTGEGEKCSDPGYSLKIEWRVLLLDGVDTWVYVCVCVSLSVDIETPTSSQMNQTLYREFTVFLKCSPRDSNVQPGLGITA